MNPMLTTDIKMIHMTLIIQMLWIRYHKKLSIEVRIVQLRRGIVPISEKIILKKPPEFSMCEAFNSYSDACKG